MINLGWVLPTAVETYYEPHSLTGLVGLVILILPTLISSAGLAWVLFRQRKTNEKVDGVSAGVKQTVKQVVNGHGDADPLRVDLDKKFDALHESLVDIKTAVAVETGKRQEADKAIGKRLDGIEGHLRARIRRPFF